MSRSLLVTRVPVLTSSQCEAQPGSSRPHADQLCAGLSHAGHTACPGDSGGGLVSRDPHTGLWTIIGIVSTGGSVRIFIKDIYCYSLF